MADTDMTRPALNGDTDPAIDDGEEEESKVSQFPSLYSERSQYFDRKFN